jgi:xanthine dehydrogenase small subunit
MAAWRRRRNALHEKALVGKAWNEENVAAALSVFASDFTPLTDMRATAEYRALAGRNLLLRFYHETTGTKEPLQVSRRLRDDRSSTEHQSREDHRRRP